MGCRKTSRAISLPGYKVLEVLCIGADFLEFGLDEWSPFLNMGSHTEHLQTGGLHIY